MPNDEMAKAELIDLPEEVLEYIFSLTSPYKDLQNLATVCRRFHRISKVVLERESINFNRSVVDGSLEWSSVHPEYGATISERYSHCAVYHDQSLYVFGGCTSSSTTFNDLWRFDLASRQWIRPLTLGTYPSPKACATMVLYKDSLVLFGGWSHPTPYPLHQAARFFNQLHLYSIATNQWTLVYPRLAAGVEGVPQGIAGHAASVVGDKMVVFGGSHGHGQSCNELWVLDLEAMVWHVPSIKGPKPMSRYGHSQVVLDDHHILVIGGCGGPNMQLTDMWLLSMAGPEWTWKEMKVNGLECCPPQLWCRAAAKVGDNVVVLSKMSRHQQQLRQQQQHLVDQMQQPKGAIRNVLVNRPSTSRNGASQLSNGAPPKAVPGSSPRMSARLEPQGSHSSRLEPLGCLNPRLEPQGMESDAPSSRVYYKRPFVHQGANGAESSSQDSSSDNEENVGGAASGCAQPMSGRFSSAAALGRTGMPSVRPNAMKNRQKQLETLKRYEERLKQLERSALQMQAAACDPRNAAQLFGKRRSLVNPMQVHVLDISKAINEGVVKWRAINTNIVGLPPEETIFFSLHHGRAELVMFGGIQTDLSSMQRDVNLRSAHASNVVHFINAKKFLR